MTGPLPHADGESMLPLNQCQGCFQFQALILCYQSMHGNFLVPVVKDAIRL